MSSSDEILHDYELFTSGRGFVELERWSTVAVAGADRVSFLQNFCTNDIKRLEIDECCEAFFADVKGKIVAHMIINVGQERRLLVTVPEQAEALIAHLDRYIITEDVQLADVTADFTWFAAIAGEARTTWSDGEGIPHVLLSIDGSSAASLVGVPSEERERTRTSMAARGLEACSAAAWEMVRIEDKLPLFGVDFDGSNLPQEVDRDTTSINFNKGCYLGQETIARIDALGHVNKKCVAVQFDNETVPPVNTELLHDGKAVGVVTSSSWSPKYKAPLALAMVRRGANDEGTKLDSELGGATVL